MTIVPLIKLKTSKENIHTQQIYVTQLLSNILSNNIYALVLFSLKQEIFFMNHALVEVIINPKENEKLL